MRHTVMVIPADGGDLRHVAGPAAGGRAVWTGKSVLGGLGEAAAGARRVAWSGSYAQVEGGGLFDEDWRTWGAKGWEVLERGVAGLGVSANGLLVRAHARHVVSDVPGCRRLLMSEWARERAIGLCFDPASMCSPGMVERSEDHLRRMYEGIGLMPSERLGMVVVAGVDELGAPCGLHACGALGAMVARLAAKWVPREAPVAVLEGGEDQQLRVLGAAGV